MHQNSQNWVPMFFSLTFAIGHGRRKRHTRESHGFSTKSSLPSLYSCNPISLGIWGSHPRFSRTIVVSHERIGVAPPTLSKLLCSLEELPTAKKPATLSPTALSGHWSLLYSNMGEAESSGELYSYPEQPSGNNWRGLMNKYPSSLSPHLGWSWGSHYYWFSEFPNRILSASCSHS